MSDLRAVARALGGEIAGGQVVGPGPGHSAKDRSMSVRLSPSAPDGFLAFSHAGDDWRECRDHVCQRLGLVGDWENRRPPKAPARPPVRSEPETRTQDALRLWREAIEPRGTPVESYLRSRSLDLGEAASGEVLRWHARFGAMLALFRNIETDEPQAMSRTFLDCEGRKLGRKFCGPVGGAAIKVDADENVTYGLHIGEGVETCLAARQLGLRPVWALGSKGAVEKFPILGGGIEALTILAEADAEKEMEVCAARWHAAGREVFINRPIRGKDLNDALKGAA